MSFKILAKVFSVSLVVFTLLVVFAPKNSFAQANPTATPEPCFENDQQVPCPTSTPEPSATPCQIFDDNLSPMPCPTETPTPTPTPCETFEPGSEFPVSCPTATPTPNDGDLCPNIEGYKHLLQMVGID